MDEAGKQLAAETRPSLPTAPGQPQCFDHEYERCGTANLFMCTEPLGGWRHVGVTGRRTKTDWAEQIRELLDVHYPDARRITLAMDNLNTHHVASLCEAFDPAEARRLIERLAAC